MGLNFLKAWTKKRSPAVAAVYDVLVAQARHPVFYHSYHVADNLSGRFDMIVLHAFLLFHRLKGEGEGARAFGQDVFDYFIEDMDRSLREMGVGYQAVPKRMKKMGQAFYGRVAAYDQALAVHAASADKNALKAALARNLFPDHEMPVSGPNREIVALTDYVLASVAALHETEFANLYAAMIPFADPAHYLTGVVDDN